MKKLFVPLVVTVAVLFVAAPYMIAQAPYESTMGLVQKIFYFHVPSWMAMYTAIAVCAISSAVFLFKGNKTIAIGIGGGLGIIMLLNVWGIIWRAQKKIIAWTADNAENGTPIPPESAQLARRAFLASRTNAWLSLPMLLMMSASHGDYIMFIK